MVNKKLIISTKAETLRSLKKLVKKSKIENLFFFNFVQWKNNEKEILDKISKKFEGKVVVRSSAISEDTENESNAGQFTSVLNVNSKKRKDIKKSVEKVLNSYKKKKNLSSFNQVIIQDQTENISVSGVVLTRGLLHNSPYYIINYDNSTGSTESVTSGLEGRTLKVLKSKWKNILQKEFKKLISAVKEIEALIPSRGLDIEFAINSNSEIIIFQVRPITIKNYSGKDLLIFKKIKEIQEQYRELNIQNRRVLGERKIFADMPDWNPAEILGDTPGYLDYSLYDYIITNQAWHEARISQGYDAGSPCKLVFLFGNKPYVDAGASFSSFIPKGISPRLRRKLILFYLEKLRKNPELQDKVEFEVVYTCYDFNFETNSKELLKNGFTKKEVEKLRDALITLTNKLVLDLGKVLRKDSESIKKMKQNRKRMRIVNIKDPFQPSLKFSKFLLDYCRKNGTVQFSRLARLAFIGKIILKSLVEKNILDEKSYDSFMESISTVATKFEEDFELMNKGRISRKKFIKKYYHLRPGTYNIINKRYESNIDLLKGSRIRSGLRKPKNFKLSKNSEKNINSSLKKEGLKFNAKELFDFTKESIEKRELFKFEFTKNLSDALELIALAGNEIGFNREELSMLGTEDLFLNIKESRNKLYRRWQGVIRRRFKEKEINDKLEFPPIIFSGRDLEIVNYYHPRPNYITQKKVIANLFNLGEGTQNVLDVKGQIVMIEHGDPGYDWIFTRKPAGLITKYGGIASHMSIRCAEFGIPAAIGCGILFDHLLKKEKIILDCQLKKITPLEAE